MENNEYLKKFRRCVNEYANMASFIDEEDNEEPQAPQPQGPEAMGGEMPAPDAMGDVPQGPDAMGGEMPAPAPDAMGGAQEGPEGLAPQGPDAMGGEMPAPDAMGGDGIGAPENMEQPGDEVIDVDDLVDAENDNADKLAKTDKRIEHLTAKFDKVISLLDKFEGNIESNNAHIEELKAEIEKRNPTPIEKMTLRSKDSYPFNKTPDEYWEKDAPENYSTEDDKNGEDDPQYKITKADIDRIDDWDSISKQINNGGFHMSLGDIMNM